MLGNGLKYFKDFNHNLAISVFFLIFCMLLMLIYILLFTWNRDIYYCLMCCMLKEKAHLYKIYIVYHMHHHHVLKDDFFFSFIFLFFHFFVFFILLAACKYIVSFSIRLIYTRISYHLSEFLHHITFTFIKNERERERGERALE